MTPQNSNILTPPPTLSAKVNNRLTVFFKNNRIFKCDKFQDTSTHNCVHTIYVWILKGYENISRP